MRRILLAILAFALLTPSASGQPADRLDHYFLVPSRSVLTQTGGFAGVENRYRLRGEYDFLRLWQGGTPDEPLRQTARFDNANIRAPLGPMLPAFIDVDELLNLEGLRGRLLPLGAPFDVYKFEGQIRDNDAHSPSEYNSTIDLYAALVGSWMFVYGETTPPVGSADFFEYEIRALARTSRPWADVNEDGAVDGSDYAAWRESQGNGLTLATEPALAMSDLRDQYGESPPDIDMLQAMMVSALQSVSVTPEPAAVALFFSGAVCALRRRRLFRSQ